MEPIPREVDVTEPAGRVSGLARMEARRLGHHYFGPEHLSLGLLLHGDNLAARVLVAHGLDLETARAEVDRLIDQGVSGVVGKGEGGGAVGGRIWIKDPSGANLSRRVAVHLIMEYAPTPTSGYLNCHDLGWDEAISPQAETTSFWNNQTQPDCGDGYYRAQVAGRFWSVSQNNWITSNWHYTGSIFITTCCRRALKKEPTFRPRPPVTGNP